MREREEERRDEERRDEQRRDEESRHAGAGFKPPKCECPARGLGSVDRVALTVASQVEKCLVAAHWDERLVKEPKGAA